MTEGKLKSRIAELRERAGLTQREVAAKVNVTEATIANWERGRRAIEFIDKLIKLCDIFNCDIRELIERENWSGIDLKEVNLEKEDFRSKNLTQAQLQRATLTKANFQGVQLAGAQLTGADLQEANLEKANLQNAVLAGANLLGANLKGANLQGAILRKADLRRADLREANWQDADFEEAQLDADLKKMLNLAHTSKLEAAPLIIGGIPDQDFEKLSEMYGSISNYLQNKLSIEVTSYEELVSSNYASASQDYESTVTAFRLGNIDLAWLGGFTLIKALDQVLDAKVIAQRDIDQAFRTVFIANRKSFASILKQEPLSFEQDGSPEALKKLLQKSKNLKFAFAAEFSTSGDLIPIHYLVKAGLDRSCFKVVRFSGSHDATIRLVTSGVYHVGALSQQVWESRVSNKEIDQDKVVQIWQSPPYQNYAWVIHSNAVNRYGSEFLEKLQECLLQMESEEQGQAILKLFGAEKFVVTSNMQYESLREIVQRREEDKGLFWIK